MYVNTEPRERRSFWLWLRNTTRVLRFIVAVVALLSWVTMPWSNPGPEDKPATLSDAPACDNSHVDAQSWEVIEGVGGPVAVTTGSAWSCSHAWSQGIVNHYTVSP